MEKVIPVRKPVEKILKELKPKVQHLYGNRLNKLLLFGSQARGEAHDDSDIDLAVVLNDENIDVFSELEQLSKITWELTLGKQELLGTVVLTQKQYAEQQDSFTRQIHREGIEL